MSLDRPELKAPLETAALIAQHRDRAAKSPGDLDAVFRLGKALLGGQPEAALPLLRRALEANPRSAECWHAYIEALIEAGRTPAARGMLEQAKARQLPAADCAVLDGKIAAREAGILSAGVLANLEAADDAWRRGSMDAAAEKFKELTSLQPGSPSLLARRAAFESERGNRGEAVSLAAAAVARRPLDSALRSTLAIMHLRNDDPTAAERELLIALNCAPANPSAWRNLAAHWKGIGRYEDACVLLEHAHPVDPGNAGLLLEHAAVLHEAGRFEEGLDRARRSVAAGGGVDAVACIAASYMGLARFQEAADAFGSLVERGDASDRDWGNLLLNLHYMPDLERHDIRSLASKWGELASRRATPKYPEASPERRSPDSPLRVGLVSGDFGNHPVGYFLDSFVQHVDPRQLQLIAFSNGGKSDDLTRRLQTAFSEWNGIGGLSDSSAASLIYRRRIDVLIDLAGHTARNRLGVFAFRPAPVQATWLGYFDTTGLPEMDYLLADDESAPLADGWRYTERIRHFSGPRWCFSAPGKLIPVSELPALRRGFVTFGSFQNLVKINDEVLGVWAKILGSIPGSRLRVQNRQLDWPDVRASFQRRARAAGIESNSLELAGRMSREDYLVAHANVDMILDTFPFPGGTTTCEAMWMGVPTLCLTGPSFIERQGAMLMKFCGLPGWISESREDYVAQAARFAGDLGGLSRLRAGLRQRFEESPLADGRSFAQSFTHLIRTLVDAPQEIASDSKIAPGPKLQDSA